jgi:hypothetical protein
MVLEQINSLLYGMRYYGNKLVLHVYFGVAQFDSLSFLSSSAVFLYWRGLNLIKGNAKGIFHKRSSKTVKSWQPFTVREKAFL